MRYAAVIHFVGNFRNVEFTVNNQFFYSLDFMGNDKLLNCHSLHFRKQVREVSVIVM